MSEDIFKYCVTAKIKDGKISKTEYDQLVLDIESLAMDGSYKFKIPSITDVDANDQVDYLENQSEDLNCFYLEYDLSGNLGVVWYFQNCESYNASPVGVSVSTLMQIFSDIQFVFAIGESAIKVQAFTYCDGSDCPLEF